MGSPVTAELVKELRRRTGVGMGKCKNALDECGGDMEEAIAFLRKAGVASAVKKGAREVNEGVVVYGESATSIALMEINAETDFVVQNEIFQEFTKNLIEELLLKKSTSVEEFLASSYSKDPSLTIDTYRSDLILSLGENLQVRRLICLPKQEGHAYGLYSHMGGKITVLVDIQGSSDAVDIAKEVALHVAAEAPDYLNPESIPADIIEKEKEIARGQVAGKPPQILEKIVAGKIEAFYGDVCLIRQKYVKDSSLKVEDFVTKSGKEKGADLKLSSFIRWQVGA